MNGSARVIRGNALDLPLEDASVDLVVTSPPYFGLRSYQDGGEHYDGQIGSEATPAEFVDALIAATSEMVRVLKPSGSIWVNLGDRFSPGMALSRDGMTSEDAAWLAGVIDSDGSISVHLNKQPEGRAPSFVPWMRVGQMKPEVVQQIAAVTGTGKVFQDTRGVWNWGASAQQAASILRLIWPWLHIKQRQALATIELARHIAEKRNKGTWSPVAQGDIAYRQSIREAVLDWNAGRPNAYEPPRIKKVALPSGRPFIQSKSLIGVPWRYALRCIDDLGLILRAEVIWSKPNGLPESVTDRVRRSHETWFHFTKEPRYFSAVDEIREAHAAHTLRYYPSGGGKQEKRPYASESGRGDSGGFTTSHPLGKLPGSVWTVPTQPLQVPAHLGVDHFAAFPMEWPRRIIHGWSPSGVCVDCGEGRTPVRSSEKVTSRPGYNVQDQRMPGRHASGNQGREGRAGDFLVSISGYACDCPEPTAATTPAVVLDPFGGTGTTALVAKALGRHGISVDMSADYCRLAEWRTTDPGELARAMQVEKPPAVMKDQLDLFGEEAS